MRQFRPTIITVFFGLCALAAAGGALWSWNDVHVRVMLLIVACFAALACFKWLASDVAMHAMAHRFDSHDALKSYRTSFNVSIVLGVLITVGGFFVLPGLGDAPTALTQRFAAWKLPVSLIYFLPLALVFLGVGYLFPPGGARTYCIGGACALLFANGFNIYLERTTGVQRIAPTGAVEQAAAPVREIRIDPSKPAPDAAQTGYTRMVYTCKTEGESDLFMCHDQTGARASAAVEARMKWNMERRAQN